MAATRLELTDDPSADAEKLISDGLDQFNFQITGQQHSRPLSVVIRDAESGDVLGGLVGRTSLGLFFADLIFVPESLRGGGVGAKIMRMAEAEAITRGCSQAFLFTIAFQAPEFYRRLGYEEFGRIVSGPPDQARVFFRKKLG